MPGDVGGGDMRERLKSERENKGMTQQKMADSIGVSLRYYQQIEAGDRIGDVKIWNALEDITGVHQRVLREMNPDRANNQQKLRAHRQA